MIIARSPLRITLGGGGTDLPSYYEKFGGFVISAAIDKYVYVSCNIPFVKKIILKYSKNEVVDSIDLVEHLIIRESLRKFDEKISCIEITSLADIPAGTGLGSSGSFTTALLKVLHSNYRLPINQKDLAEEACDIEINKLGDPVGKQDQYISSFGGITCFDFNRNNDVNVYPLNIDKNTLHCLEDNLLLFFTGYSRSASSILKTQNDLSKNNDSAMIENLHFVKDLGYRSKEALERGDLYKFSELMNIHWEHKKKRSGSMSNGKINEWYELAMKNGAIGGKLIGAGGGGFLMFYAEEKNKLRKVMADEGLEEVRFRFDFEGTKIIV